VLQQRVHRNDEITGECADHHQNRAGHDEEVAGRSIAERERTFGRYATAENDARLTITPIATPTGKTPSDRFSDGAAA
jgi:hypothetical protein